MFFFVYHLKTRHVKIAISIKDRWAPISTRIPVITGFALQSGTVSDIFKKRACPCSYDGVAINIKLTFLRKVTTWNYIPIGCHIQRRMAAYASDIGRNRKPFATGKIITHYFYKWICTVLGQFINSIIQCLF